MAASHFGKTSLNIARAASAVAIASLVSNRAVRATTYVGTNVSALLTGASTTTGLALNDGDQVVGYYTPTTGSGSLPFLYVPGVGASAGTTTAIPNVGQGYTSMATGINDAGLVVGSDYSINSAFTYNANSGAFTSVAPGASNYGITFRGVNSAGVAVGSLQGGASANYLPTGIVYVPATGTVTNVGIGFTGTPSPSNNVRNSAYAINDNGIVTGTGYVANASSGASNSVPYLATPKAGGGYSYINLGSAITASDPVFQPTSAGSYSGAGDAIDAQGNVAGDYSDGRRLGGAFLYNALTGTAVTVAPNTTAFGQNGSSQYAFAGLVDINGVPEAVGTQSNFISTSIAAIVFRNGTLTSLASAIPGYTLTSATAVNGNGDVVAMGTPTGGGAAQTFLLQATTQTWNNANATGDGTAWDVAMQNFHNNSGGASAFSSANADNVLFSDGNNNHYAVTLNSTVTPFAITFNNSGGNYVVSGTGTIGGGGGFVKAGTGRVTLNIASTFTGPVAVMGGQLTVNGSIAAANTGFTTDVTVSPGATLSGTGTIGRTVNVSGTITGGSGKTAGDTAGTLTTNAQAWNAAGGYVAKVTSIGVAANVNDTLVMSGLTVTPGFAVSLLATTGGTAKFMVSNPALTSTPLPGSYVVLATDSEPSVSNPFLSQSTLAGLNLQFSNGGVQTAFTGDSVVLATMAVTGGGGYDLIAEDVLAATPEPTSLLLAGLAAAPLVLRRRPRLAVPSGDDASAHS